MFPENVEIFGPVERQQNQRYFLGSIAQFQERHGWFFGHFMQGLNPLLTSGKVETAVIQLPPVVHAKPHYHKIGTEITFVISGELHLFIDGEKVTLKEGEFMVVPPGVVLQNPTNKEGTKVFVVKFPSIPDDKFDV